jgi:pyrroloquinoline quinone biosynthesis protein D
VTGTPVDTELVAQYSMDARFRKFRGKLLISNGEEALELDEVASFIFGQIDGERSVADIARILAGEYGISFEEAAADIADLLHQLADENVVTLSSPGQSG